MKKELFDAIGEIEVNTDEKFVKTEIDRTYAIVMNKIHYYEGKQRKKKIIVRMIAASISVAAVLGIFVLSKNSTIDTYLDSPGQVVEKQEKADTSNKVDVVVYVYEAQNKSQPVTSLYASEMVKREVKDKKIYLGSYSPLMSSVPGYPIIVSNNRSDEFGHEGISIRIRVDNGNLVSWDKNTGKITEIGKKGLFELGDNIYWSPLDDGASSKSAQIIVDLLEDKNKIATSGILIEEQEPGIYTAEKMN